MYPMNISSYDDADYHYEKACEAQLKALQEEELETQRYFRDIYDSADHVLGTFECHLEKDGEALDALNAYGDEFVEDAIDLLELLKSFKKKYQHLY